MNAASKAHLEGHVAARNGLPASRNPYRPGESVRTDDGSIAWLDLIWFNSWHITKTELEERAKFVEHEVRNEEL